MSKLGVILCFARIHYYYSGGWGFPHARSGRYKSEVCNFQEATLCINKHITARLENKLFNNKKKTSFLKNKMQQQRSILFGLSLILLLVGELRSCFSSLQLITVASSSGMECMPVEPVDSPPQPARCRLERPRSSKTSECLEGDNARRYFLHETNPKGCKKFGICPKDAEVYDASEENNYFLSFEDCQRECMQRE